MSDRRTESVPTAALWLGLAGLVPFVACALQITAGWPMPARYTGPALYALTIYAAVILGFMGGVQWGLAMRQHDSEDWQRYGVSVVPAFVACAGLWIGARDGLMILAAGFSALYVYDRWTVAHGSAPVWYGRLRGGLTAGVVTSLLTAAWRGPF